MREFRFGGYQRDEGSGRSDVDDISDGIFIALVGRNKTVKAS